MPRQCALALALPPAPVAAVTRLVLQHGTGRGDLSRGAVEIVDREGACGVTRPTSARIGAARPAPATAATRLGLQRTLGPASRLPVDQLRLGRARHDRTRSTARIKVLEWYAALVRKRYRQH